MSSPIAKTIITRQSQEEFAALTGDRNPIHMDPMTARRTQAGEPVLHGMHVVLWVLEELAACGRLPMDLARIRIRFSKWMYPGDELEVHVLQEGPSAVMVAVHAYGSPMVTVELLAGEKHAASGEMMMSPPAPRTAAVSALMEDLSDRKGLAYVPRAEAAARNFPESAARIGAAAVAEIAACSYVVGMEAPGLLSMFSKADLTLNSRTNGERPALQYEVPSVDARFRKARIAVLGTSLHGTLEAFVRNPPVAQAGLDDVRSAVDAQEFSEMRALVVGGSRGLGELAAKCIAAAGGHVTITYAMGRSDAEAIARAAPARIGTLAYDVRQPAAKQLAKTSGVFTHVFYFATNAIFRPATPGQSQARLADFTAFYLDGFRELCVELRRSRDGSTAASLPLVIYYPSSVAVEERPAGMEEYAAVKSAGEHLCSQLEREMPDLRIFFTRLPRLRTDQTAGVLPEREVDPLPVVLEIVREAQRLADESTR